MLQNRSVFFLLCGSRIDKISHLVFRCFVYKHSNKPMSDGSQDIWDTRVQQKLIDQCLVLDIYNACVPLNV